MRAGENKEHRKEAPRMTNRRDDSLMEFDETPVPGVMGECTRPRMGGVKSADVRVRIPPWAYGAEAQLEEHPASNREGVEFESHTRFWEG